MGPLGTGDTRSSIDHLLLAADYARREDSSTNDEAVSLIESVFESSGSSGSSSFSSSISGRSDGAKPHHLFKQAVEMLKDDENEGMKLIKKAVKIDKSLWSCSHSRLKKRIRRIARAEAAHRVALAYEQGELPDFPKNREKALKYYRIAQERLSHGKTDVYAISYFNAACLLQQEPSSDSLLKSCAEWFELAATAEESPMDDGSYTAWGDAASVWTSLALREGSVLQKKECSGRALNACMRALHFRSSNPESRTFCEDVKFLRDSHLNESTLNAVCSLGHLLSSGYYASGSDIKVTNNKLATILYLKALNDGELDSLCWTVEAYLTVHKLEKAISLISDWGKYAKSRKVPAEKRPSWNSEIEEAKEMIKLYKQGRSSEGASSSSSSSAVEVSPSTSTDLSHFTKMKAWAERVLQPGNLDQLDERTRKLVQVWLEVSTTYITKSED